MASLTYTQHYADETKRQVRRVAKQGAPVKPQELRRAVQITTHVTQSEADIIKEKAKLWNMSQSAFVSLALDAGIRLLFESNNR